jgi:uncharacterized protein (DUF952 family)
VIFHIVRRDEWEVAKRSGSYAPASVEVEGFIHCSTHRQLIATANRFYRGQAGLVVLCIEEKRVAMPLKYEAPSMPSQLKSKIVESDREMSEGKFPHIHGALNLDAVVKVVELRSTDDGGFEMPEELQVLK